MANLPVGNDPKYSRIRATYSQPPVVTPTEPPDRWQHDLAVVVIGAIVLIVLAFLASLSVAR